MRFRDILAMPYGTPEQIAQADAWYARLMRLWTRDNPPYAVVSAWHQIHNHDVIYQARRRWLGRLEN